MFDKRILNTYAIIIGVSFLVSGVGKLVNTAEFADLIYRYGFGRLMLLAPLIVIFEITIGLMLVLLINPRRYLLLSFILLTIFTIAFAYGHFKNGVDDCGCFGTVLHTHISPVYTFIRNLILLGMSIVVWWVYPNEKTVIPGWKIVSVFGVLCISSFVAGFTFRMPGFLQPAQPVSQYNYQNEDINNTEIAKYIKASPDSVYLVFCFSYTCPHCLNSIENLRSYKKNKMVDRIIALGIGPDSSKQVFVRNFQPDFNIKDISPGAMYKLTNLYPTAFYIKNDTIKAVVQGELPAPVVFKSQYNMVSIKN